MEPSTGACISPITSSSVKSTAAMGVLNAAASAAEAPTGTSALTLLVLKPSLRPSTEAMPADHLHRRTFAAQRDAARQ